MPCIQRKKDGNQCTRMIGNHPNYPTYCNYHSKRFEEGKDEPNPFQENETNGITLPPFPINLEQLRFIDIPFPNQEREEQLVRNFIQQHRRHLFEIIQDRNDEERDLVLFEFIMEFPQQQQEMLLIHYEKFVELILYLRNHNRFPDTNPRPRNLNRDVVVQGIFQNRDDILQLLNNAFTEDEREEIRRGNRRENLQDFVNDKENVHTAEVVKPVLSVSQKLISMAEKKSKEQDTFREVIGRCDLSDAGRKQLCLMYYSEESIYGLPTPTFRKVLDGLWYYILQQKEDIQKDICCRLSQELEDNVGACPMGNLSRLVNVLSGFMEEATQGYKPSLQDSMAKISQISEKKLRLQETQRILQDYKVEPKEWETWMNAMEEL